MAWGKLGSRPAAGKKAAEVTAGPFFMKRDENYLDFLGGAR